MRAHETLLTRLVFVTFCVLLPSAVPAQENFFSVGSDACGVVPTLPAAVGPETLGQLLGPLRSTLGTPLSGPLKTNCRPIEEKRDWADNITRTKRNADGTTDTYSFNPRTGGRPWSQHLDPQRNLQYGVNKAGQPWGPSMITTHPGGPWGDVAGYDVPPTVIFQPSEHDLWLRDWWKRPMDGPFSNHVVESTIPATEDDEDASMRAAAAEVAFAERQRQAAVGVVLSRMRPGALVEAARAAARQRCLKEVQDEAALNACLKDADQK